uniref:Zinc finger protein RFP-like n=1 Tax=Chelonoidis abingdonii TaxID=106734 RepID=A0A8C0J3Z2_CHEAB
MASENPMASLQYEATCPICLGDFKDPVIIDCGHNFCRACIAQCWEGSSTAATCPQCRETVQQRNLRPNRQLANVLKIVKQLNLQVMKDAGGERVCVEHQEPLKLFCEEDQTPICLVCDRSRTHKAHTVVPIEEAAQEYKVGNHSAIYVRELPSECRMGCNKLLLLLLICICDHGCWGNLTEIRQKIVSEFQQLRQFLEEQERLLLAQLEKLDKEIGKIQNENITKFSEQISRLSELISELEGKCQKPKNPRSVQRDKTAPESWAQESSCQRSQCNSVCAFLKCELYPGMRISHTDSSIMNVTLDPGTAHPQLILSEDRKSVRWEETRQDLPNHPERFDTEICVLGCEGFTSGRHCWGVEVGNRGSWAVGVARESVKRKGGISPNPEQGIWAVERCWDQFHALTSPRTPLPVSWDPRKIRVCLDCERGQVTFFDAGDESPLFTLTLVPNDQYLISMTLLPPPSQQP